jgi:hypothetical protein
MHYPYSNVGLPTRRSIDEGHAGFCSDAMELHVLLQGGLARLAPELAAGDFKCTPPHHLRYAVLCTLMHRYIIAQWHDSVQ